MASVRFDIEPALGALSAAIDDEVEDAMERGAKIVADDAAANHTFHNRTGELERRIVPGKVTGRATRGLVRATVLGDKKYGKYVDEGTERMAARPFLAPALERREDDVLREVETGLTIAFRRAWGTR